MTSRDREERHSRALEPELVTDPQKRRRRRPSTASANTTLRLRQFRKQLIASHSRYGFPLILGLHRQALQGISSYAGNFRPAEVRIEGSRHAPPGAHLVPELVEEMCDYVNQNWQSASAVHLASYVMWRLNWVHPFADGNGRTSRVLSFVTLSVKIGMVLPGTPTLPELIVDHRQDYEDALDASDDAWKAGRVDVSKMESLVSSLLAKQLTNVYARAGGKVENAD